MAKEQVLGEIRAARASLLAAIAGLPDDALLRSHVVGYWSIKDVLAHLTVWQSELITALDHVDNPGQVPHIVEIDDIDEFNEEQYRVNVRRPLAIILEDWRGVHKHLLESVAALNDETLDDGARFDWMEGEPLSYLIAENGYWHEQEHAEQIQAWREENKL